MYITSICLSSPVFCVCVCVCVCFDFKKDLEKRKSLGVNLSAAPRAMAKTLGYIPNPAGVVLLHPIKPI